MPALVIAALRWRSVWLCIAGVSMVMTAVGIVGFVDVVWSVDFGFAAWLGYGMTWPVSVAIFTCALIAWSTQQGRPHQRTSFLVVLLAALGSAIFCLLLVGSGSNDLGYLAPVAILVAVAAAMGLLWHLGFRSVISG
jgi:hypothetical protein